MPTNSTENIYSTEFENDPTPIPSSKIGYDNSESGLEATTVQGAIDELDSKIKASDEASEITYDNTESELEATNVQGAIDEVAQDMSNLTNDVDILKNNYQLIEMSNDEVLASSETYGVFAAHAFDLIKNFISNLNDDEIIEIVGIDTSTSHTYMFNNAKFFTKAEVDDAGFDYEFVFTTEISGADNDGVSWSIVHNVMDFKPSTGSVKRFIFKTALDGSSVTNNIVSQNLDALTSTRDYYLVYKLYKKVTA